MWSEMMQLIDASNRLIKTPEVIDFIFHLVRADSTLATLISEIHPEPQPWGQSALHFSAHLIHSGHPVLLKVNVPFDQLWWTRQLAHSHPHLLPHLFASGDQLGETPLGWLLWERVRGGLHPGWLGREFDLILDAGVAFQLAARALAPAAQAAGALAQLRVEDLAERLEQGVRRGAPGPAARVLARVFEHWNWVTEVCEMEVCHGDLHLANAVCRELPPEGVALLIDHHPTRMPWACEAAKPEILNAEPSRAGCRGLIAKQAAMRTGRGLSTPEGAELARLQAIVLGWWALQMWADIGPSPAPTWRRPEVWQAENSAYIAAAAAA
jgi:hypothetical protein